MNRMDNSRERGQVVAFPASRRTQQAGSHEVSATNVVQLSSRRPVAAAAFGAWYHEEAMTDERKH